jgi:hypothetical protein
MDHGTLFRGHWMIPVASSFPNVLAVLAAATLNEMKRNWE